MRQFDYREKWKNLLTPEIVSYLTQIHEFKGEQTLFIEVKADTLTQLVEIAKIQSTESSNKIEGIYTSDIRLRELVKDKTRPRTRNEQEIAGYRDVLNTIHESHDHIPPKSAIILQLHRDLYKFESYNIGGKYKTADNVIEEEDSQGIKKIRFKPVPAWETPEAMEELCRAFEEAMATGEIDPLLLIPMFILDFLCIHPFNDGNGRMSRLLTLLLLYRSGYIVGKYISIERMIENSKELYYECLRESSENWYENKNDYIPFIKYMLGIQRVFFKDKIADNTEYIKTGANRRDYKKHSGNNYKKGNRRKVSGYQCGNDTENTGRITDSRKNFKNRRRKVYEIYLE